MSILVKNDCRKDRSTRSLVTVVFALDTTLRYRQVPGNTVPGCLLALRTRNLVAIILGCNSV
jgi:hypothetical protein